MDITDRIDLLLEGGIMPKGKALSEWNKIVTAIREMTDRGQSGAITDMIHTFKKTYGLTSGHNLLELELKLQLRKVSRDRRTGN